MRKPLIPAFVLAISALASSFAPSANAAAVAGNGTLTATGTGTVAVRGAINYQATAGAKSILLVKDVAGDASVTVTGETGHAPYGNFTAYFGFASATITGTDVAAVAIGTDLNIAASGHGWAYLKGTGTYSVDGGPSRNWDGAGGLASFVGRGTLVATGTGVAAVRGLMDYQATAGAGAILFVKDVAGDATINVTGATSQAPYGTFTAYFGFTGVTVTGTDVAVAAVGSNLSINVTGRGWAYLKGTGTYTINGGATQNWKPDGGFAGLVAPGS